MQKTPPAWGGATSLVQFRRASERNVVVHVLKGSGSRSFGLGLASSRCLGRLGRRRRRLLRSVLALLGLPAESQLQVAKQIVGRGLTVRQVEALVQGLRAGRVDVVQKSKPEGQDPDLRRLLDQISSRLGAVVSIRHTAGGGGRLMIRYNSLDELDGVLEQLGGGD